MNSDEFLKELQFKLRGLPETERVNAVRFFEEYIHKANLSPGTDVTTICGTPEEAARQVMSGSIDNKAVKRSVRAHETKSEREGRHNGILGAIVVLALLITGGLVVLGALGIAFDIKRMKFFSSSDKNSEIVELGDFSSVEVEGDTANVMLIADGDDYRVDYSVVGDDIKWDVNGGKLTLKYDSPSMIGINFSGNNSYINVHVPKGSELKDIVLNNDTSSVELKDIICNSAKLNTDTGRTSVTGTKAGELSLSSSTGSISVDETSVEKELIVDADTGSINISNSSLGDAKLESDTGSLHFKDSDFNNLEAELDTGSIHITTSGKPEDYNMELETDTGNVYINGNKEGKSYEQSGSTGKTIKAETDTGSVNVNFD